MFQGMIDWTRLLIVLYPDHAHPQVQAMIGARNNLGTITAHDSIHLWALHAKPEMPQISNEG